MSTTIQTLNVATQKASYAALLAALVAGIKQDLAGVDPIELNGTSYKQADLVARIEAVLASMASVKGKRMDLTQAVEQQNALVAAIRPIRAAVKQYAQAKFGASSTKLQDFGFTPRRPPTTTAQAKAQAQLKGQATRVARGTTSKKQKLAIHGTPVPVATAPTASAPPVAVATPPTASIPVTKS